MQIIERLRERISIKRLSVLKVSNETGISAYKMYKWLDGKGHPKHDDVMILDKWLSGKMEKVLSEEEEKPKTTRQPTALVIAKEDLDALTKKVEAIWIVVQQNQKLLQALNDQADNEVDVPGLSNIAQGTRSYKKDKQA